MFATSILYHMIFSQYMAHIYNIYIYTCVYYIGSYWFNQLNPMKWPCRRHPRRSSPIPAVATSWALAPDSWPRRRTPPAPHATPDPRRRRSFPQSVGPRWEDGLAGLGMVGGWVGKVETSKKMWMLRRLFSKLVLDLSNEADYAHAFEGKKCFGINWNWKLLIHPRSCWRNINRLDGSRF